MRSSRKNVLFPFLSRPALFVLVSFLPYIFGAFFLILQAWPSVLGELRWAGPVGILFLSTFSVFFCLDFPFGAELPGHRCWPPLKHLLSCSKIPEKDKKLHAVLITNLIFKDSYLVKKQIENWGFIPKLNALPKLAGPKNF